MGCFLSSLLFPSIHQYCDGLLLLLVQQMETAVSVVHLPHFSRDPQILRIAYLGIASSRTGYVDSTFVKCTFGSGFGFGFVSTSTAGVVLPEENYQGNELSQFCWRLY